MGNLLEGCGVPTGEEEQHLDNKKLENKSPVRRLSKKKKSPSKLATPAEPHKALEQSDPRWYIPFDQLDRTESVGASSGIGMVFKATYSKTGAEVAAKRMPMPMLGGESLDHPYLSAMKAEGRKLAELQHQNILHLLGMSVYRSERSGRYDLYLVTELMNCSFNQLVFSKDQKFKQKRAKLTGKDRQRILMQIAAGLAFLHYHSIVHRNLKPTNILLNESLSVVKVTDYGAIACLREHELNKLDTLEANEDKQLKGSRLYVAAFMAPEQVVSDGKITLYPSQKGKNKVDSYSYAMVLYAFTTGLRPYADFNKSKMFTMMEQILDGLRPTVPSAFPAALRELLEKCWCKNPNERLSMAKVVKELQMPAIAKALSDVWVP